MQELPHAWTGPIPAAVSDGLASPGEPLKAGLRAQMESRFGHDFGKVRVHRDGRAAGSARAVQTRTYTVGHEVVLGSVAAGLGRRGIVPLLGHGRSHVVQRERASPSPGSPWYCHVPGWRCGTVHGDNLGPRRLDLCMRLSDYQNQTATPAYRMRFCLERFILPSDRNVASHGCMTGRIMGGGHVLSGRNATPIDRAITQLLIDARA